MVVTGSTPRANKEELLRPMGEALVSFVGTHLPTFSRWLRPGVVEEGCKVIRKEFDGRNFSVANIQPGLIVVSGRNGKDQTVCVRGSGKPIRVIPRDLTKDTHYKEPEALKPIWVVAEGLVINSPDHLRFSGAHCFKIAPSDRGKQKNGEVEYDIIRTEIDNTGTDQKLCSITMPRDPKDVTVKTFLSETDNIIGIAISHKGGILVRAKIGEKLVGCDIPKKQIIKPENIEITRQGFVFLTKNDTESIEICLIDFIPEQRPTGQVPRLDN